VGEHYSVGGSNPPLSIRGSVAYEP